MQVPASAGACTCEATSAGTRSSSSNHPDVDGHGKHFCHYEFPSPAWPPCSVKLLFLSLPPRLCFARARGNLRHKRCIHTVILFYFFPQIKSFTCGHRAESIIILVLLSGGQITHHRNRVVSTHMLEPIKGVTFPLPRHFNRNLSSP